LHQTQRKTVTLLYIGEYSLAEVAQIQDTPVGTIKRGLREARKKRKEDLVMVEDVLKHNAPDAHRRSCSLGRLVCRR
jgi:DNA-directed RNA polymerase specialized sigma24 family protein